MALTPFATLVVMSVFALSMSSARAENNALAVEQQGDIPYVTGGIGEDETVQLEATQADYNLRVMNADKTGHFSGDTRIVISDLQHNVLLDATSGPIFYANLPKGRYIVEGFAGEQSKTQTIRIVSGKTTRIRFMWAQDVNEINTY